jgi:hypothetical protein
MAVAAGAGATYIGDKPAESVAVNASDRILTDEYNQILIDYAESLEGWNNPFPPTIVYKTMLDASQMCFPLGFAQRMFLFLSVPASRYIIN